MSSSKSHIRLRRPELNPLGSLIAISGFLLQSVFLVYNIVSNERPVIGPDALLFQYSGWYASQGGVIYTEIWDVKPPVIHLFAEIIARVSFSDPYVIYILSSMLGILAFSLLLYTTYSIILLQLENKLAALAGSVFLFTFPTFYTFAIRGLRPKMFMLLFGSISILYLYKERPAVSGAFAALSAGLWQIAIIFPVIATLYYIKDKKYKQTTLVFLGMGTITIIVVLPYILRGAADDMLIQVVIAPFIGHIEQSLFSRLLQGGYMVNFAAPLIVVGTIGAIQSFNKSELWWVGIGAVWSSLQVFFFDLDGSPDLLLGYFFVAIGLGLFTHRLNNRRNRIVLLASVFIVALAVFFLQMFLSGPLPSGSQQLETLYWSSIEPDTCHVRRSAKEVIVIEYFEGTETGTMCDKYSFVEVIRDMLL